MKFPTTTHFPLAFRTVTVSDEFYFLLWLPFSFSRAPHSFARELFQKKLFSQDFPIIASL